MSFLERLKLSRSVAISILIPITSLVAGFGGGWVGSQIYNQSNSPTKSTEARRQYISSESQLITQIAKEVGASVVSIDVQSETTGSDFFDLGLPSRQRSAGTGFIVNSNGIIVTNRHVIPVETTNVSVTLSDGTKYTDVQIIGRTKEDSPLDIAFLKITDSRGKKLKPAGLGDSSKVQVGERVVAIGNALGEFENTVTSGIISGFDRDVIAADETGQDTEALTDLIQTDAAINAGNSGGPLVNIDGQVIGINTAVAGEAQNIGFAIPINSVKNLINSVVTQGELKQPFLGVRYTSLNDELAAQLNLSVKRGAYILPTENGEPSIIPGSPAQKAGLREKDVITKVNNLKIDERTSLSSALNQFRVGQTITLTVVRGSETIKIQATLADTPDS